MRQIKRSMAAILALLLMLNCCGSVPAFALEPDAADSLTADADTIPEDAAPTAAPGDAPDADGAATLPEGGAAFDPEPLPGIVIPAPTPEPGATPVPQTEIVKGPTAAPSTPETADPATSAPEPETAGPKETATPPIAIPDPMDVLYADLPDAPTGSYIGSKGLPVATGQVKISVGLWDDDLLTDAGEFRLDADALNTNAPDISVGKQDGTEYAIVPVLVQVEYPEDGSTAHISLPEDVTLLDFTSTATNICPADTQTCEDVLQNEFHEASAWASGFYLQATGDFSVAFTYTASDGSELSKTLSVHVTEETAGNPLPVTTDNGVATIAVDGRPDPPYTTGKITSIAKENGSWLLWFNNQEAYCCTHGLNGQPKGCPPYTYSYTSILEPGQYIPGDHYGNQVRIWGALGQISLGLPASRKSNTATISEDVVSCMDYYDDVQRYIIEQYPDSEAAQIYASSAEAAEQHNAEYGISTISGENGYYSFIFQPSISGWQTIAIPGPPIGDEPAPEIPPAPVEYYSNWTAQPQSASGQFDLTYTLNPDKVGLVTREKVDGAVIDIEPVTKSGSIDGGSWSISPAAKQTVTTSGHRNDDTYHQTGGAASASWSLHYAVSKTSSGGRSGQVGPCSSQEEADAQAASARSSAENELRTEAQNAVNAAIAAARQQLATLQFTVDEVTVPVGMDADGGAHGSHQQVGAGSNSTTTVLVENDEWALQVNIDKTDAETGQRIAGDTAFEVFEWDVAAQLYVPKGGYNQYSVDRNSDGTYSVANGSSYASSAPANRTLYRTQRNEGRFIIVETKAPSGYYGDWTDIAAPGEAGSVAGKRAYYIEITKELDGQTISLDNADYNADIATADNGGTRLRTSSGQTLTVNISATPKAAARTYQTDPTGQANNEDSFTMTPSDGKFINSRVLGQIVLNKTDLDAMVYLAAGTHGNATLDGAVYDLYCAEDIKHPDGKTGVVDYAKITDASGSPIWHTTVHTNAGWDDDFLPILKKDNLVASAAIEDGQLTITDLYLGRYYLVERSTGAVLPVDGSSQYYNSGSYPLVNGQLERTGKTQKLAEAEGKYTDYIYRNQYSAVAESRTLSGSRKWDGYYLSFAQGYLCDETNHYAALAYADEAQYIIRSEDTSQDAVLKSGFELTKLVSTSGPPAPAPVLEGAGFTVYRVSDLSKAAQFKCGPDGRYDLQSILAAYRADRYDQDSAKYDFSGEAQAVARMFENDTGKVETYNATLTSDGEYVNGKGNGWEPTRESNEYRLAEVFTNSLGKFRVDGLAYGQYLVVETTRPRDVFQAAPFLILVDSTCPQSVFCAPLGTVTTPSGNYLPYYVLDEEFEVYLQITKTDAETGKAVRAANTAFSIYYLDDTGHYRLNDQKQPQLVEMPDPAIGAPTAKTTVFYTDAEGRMKTPEKLPLGHYRAVEVTGPRGLYNEWADTAFYRSGALAGSGTFYVDFEVTTDGVYQVQGHATNDMDDATLKADYTNRETLGQLTIHKSGDVLTGYEGGDFIYEQTDLAGAVFEIRAKGDVPTQDNQGTFWYLDGDLVATVTTGADGQIDNAAFAPTRTVPTYDFLSVIHDGTAGEVTVTLPLGVYEIREVKPPYAFTLSEQTYTVTLTWADQTSEVVLAESITKKDGEDETTARFEIVDADTATEAEQADRKLIFRNERVVPVPREDAGHIGVGIYKRDRESRELLPGAVYQLFTVDAIYDVQGDKLADAGALLATSEPTGEDGFTWFAVDIPIRGERYAKGFTAPENRMWDAAYNSGRYRIVEQVAPAGSLLDTTPLEVDFTYTGAQEVWQVVEATQTNLKTTVLFSKRDLFSGKELPGAVMTVQDESGTEIHKWTSSQAPYIIRGLEIGKVYTLTEQQSPLGYALAESITFKLEQATDERGDLLQSTAVYIKDDAGEWQLAEDQTVIMLDAPSLVIHKTDVGGKELPGAHLVLMDGQGAFITSWVSEETPHEIPVTTPDDPQPGSVTLSDEDEDEEHIYCLHEDAAPENYLVASEILFKVVLKQDGDLAVYHRTAPDAPWDMTDAAALTMVDKPKPTPQPTPEPIPETPAPTPMPVRSIPQTGDPTPLAPLFALLFLSAGGLLGFGWYYFKRR